MFGLAIQFQAAIASRCCSVGVFFIAGIILLPLVDVRKAIAEAGNEVPDK